jgi:hypothetical protein
MRRYIVLLLITGIVWAQTDFDKLVLKDGTTYFGEYIKIEGEIVFFKPLERLYQKEAFAFQPISINKIKILQLKDGHFIIGIDENILTYEEYQKKSLEENQKLSTKNVVIIGCIIVVIFIVVEANSFSLRGLGEGGGMNCGPPCGSDMPE